MTDDMMNLRGLMEKSSAADFLSEMIGYSAKRLMELEVSGLTGAAHGEKSADRQVQRNGYRDRIGKRAPARWSCVSPSFAAGATFRGSWSPGACRKRR